MTEKTYEWYRERSDGIETYPELYEAKDLIYQVAENLRRFQNGTLRDGLTATAAMFADAVSIALGEEIPKRTNEDIPQKPASGDCVPGWVLVNDRMPEDYTILYEIVSDDGDRFCAFPPLPGSTSWTVVKRFSDNDPTAIHTWGIEAVMWFHVPAPPLPPSDKAIMARTILANIIDDAHDIATGERICRYCTEDESRPHKVGCITHVAERALKQEGQSYERK